MKMKKTIGFTIVCGVAPGYFHNMKGVAAPELAAKIATLWQEVAEKHFAETNIYVSATVTPGAVVYSPNWGCPDGGESIIMIQGVANPEFVKNLEDYRDVVLQIAKELKNKLDQSTLTVEFIEKELAYLK
jgi:hypothetical protein